MREALPSHKNAALGGSRDTSEFAKLRLAIRRFDETIKNIRVDLVGVLKPRRLDLVSQVISHRIVQVVQVAILVLWERRIQPNLYDFLAKFLRKNLVARQVLQDIITDCVLDFHLRQLGELATNLIESLNSTVDSIRNAIKR